MEPAPQHHHHAHPHPHHRRRRRTTIAKLVGKSAGHFLAAPLLFLLLAVLPFSFRHTLHSGSLLLSFYLLRRDPSLPSLLTRLSLPPDPHLPTPRSRRPSAFAASGPLVHLTRVGTLHHHDLLSDDDAPFSPRPNASFPASFPLPHAATRLRVVARPPASSSSPPTTPQPPPPPPTSSGFGGSIWTVATPPSSSSW